MANSPVPVLTIDGPVASGKGTVARRVAEALGFHLLDSGAIYRAHAFACLRQNTNANDIKALEDTAKVLALEFLGDQVWIDGANATQEIRAEAVGLAASALSAIPDVRAALLQRQRDFAKAPGLVADGRDMGTVVFPDAALKIYLTTTAHERATRRALQVVASLGTTNSPKQLIEKGNSDTILGSLGLESPLRSADAVRAQVEAQIRQRDAQDKSRAIAPLRPAAGAIVIDNANHTPEQTVAGVLALWRLRR
ncbi:MAG: (d)CMP kinase [Burkholderiales bacterium]|nr:(d)CMP kinase [Burkholderiales bacterium]